VTTEVARQHRPHRPRVTAAQLGPVAGGDTTSFVADLNNSCLRRRFSWPTTRSDLANPRPEEGMYPMTTVGMASHVAMTIDLSRCTGLGMFRTCYAEKHIPTVGAPADVRFGFPTADGAVGQQRANILKSRDA
jgi:hypothetical protein